MTIVLLSSAVFFLPMWLFEPGIQHMDNWQWEKLVVILVMVLGLERFYRNIRCDRASLTLRLTFLVCVMFFACHAMSGIEQYTFSRFCWYVVVVGSVLATPASSIVAIVELLKEAVRSEVKSNSHQ